MDISDLEDDVSYLKREIDNLLHNKPTTTGILALVCCLSEVISQTAPSRESAMEGIAAVTTSLATAIGEFDMLGLCRWNEPLQ